MVIRPTWWVAGAGISCIIASEESAPMFVRLLFVAVYFALMVAAIASETGILK